MAQTRKRHLLAIVFFLLFAFVWRDVCAWSVWSIGSPDPGVHDEFSYLLQADTFLHGRLANPPLKYPEFFASPHVLTTPTYASKYPPAQALWLALGGSFPYSGVLWQGAALVFLTAYMLYRWTSFLTAIAVMIPFALGLLPPLYWFKSFWGGGAAAVGCAVVLLGVAEVWRHQRAWGGLFIGLGWIMLFLSRPFEGTIATAGLLLACFFFTGRNWRTFFARWLKYAAIPVAAGLLWTGYYNHAVTGNAFLLPYLVHDRQNNTVPVLWFLPLKPEPAYLNPRLKAQHGHDGWEAQKYRETRSGLGPIRAARGVFSTFGELTGRLALLLLFIFFVPWTFRIKVLATALAIAFVPLLGETWQLSHYQAPALIVFVALAGCIVAELRQTSLGRYRVAAAVGLILLSAAADNGLRAQYYRREGWKVDFGDFGSTRASFLRQFNQRTGSHLIFVRYAPWDQNIDKEWVYNSAAIDSQRTIIAYDLGGDRNRKLIDYYPDRQVWRMVPNGSRPPEIQPYTPEPIVTELHSALVK